MKLSDNFIHVILELANSKNNRFTKDDIISTLDKNGIIVKDFDLLISINKDFIIKNNDEYYIDLTIPFNNSLYNHSK